MGPELFIIHFMGCWAIELHKLDLKRAFDLGLFNGVSDSRDSSLPTPPNLSLTVYLEYFSSFIAFNARYSIHVDINSNRGQWDQLIIPY